MITFRTGRRLVGVAALSTCVFTLAGCCENCLDRVQREVDLIRLFIQQQYGLCCNPLSTPAEQGACIQDKGAVVGEVQSQLGALFQACRDRNEQRIREIYDEIKRLLGITGAVAQGDDGVLRNTLPLFLDDEWMSFNAAASAVRSRPRDAVLIGGTLYTTHAAGNAEAQAIDQGAAVAVQHIDEDAVNAVTFTTYAFDAGSSLTLGTQWGALPLALSGTVVASEFQATGDAGLRAAIEDFTWSINSSFLNESTDFKAVASHPGNEIVIDQQGHGVMTLVGRIISSSRPSMSTIREAVVLHVPVTFDGGLLTFDITTAQGALLGSELAPVDQVDPYVPAQGVHPWCEDADGNGIPDKADEDIAIWDDFVTNTLPGWCG